MNLENPSDYITLAVARQKYLPFLSVETVERMCRDKKFKTAIKTSASKFAHWRVQRLEVQQFAYVNNTEFRSVVSV